MQIAIEIPETWIEEMKGGEFIEVDALCERILNGTLLPEHHSELVDKREVFKKFYNRSLAHAACEVLSEVTTIIPATE